MKAVSVDKITLSAQKECSQQEKSLSTLDVWAKKMVLQWFDRLELGCLLVEDGEAQYSFGEDAESASLVAKVVIHDAITYRDLIANGLVGAGESYMRGAWSTPDLVTAVRVFAANFQSMKQGKGIFARLDQHLSGLMHRIFKANSKENSRLNIAAHYDLGNDFFNLFLDKSMMYSSAIFPREEASLEEAAEYKLDHICQRLQLNENDHMLEIGTGWGGMAIYAAKHYGCRVTTTTISKEQYAYACEQVKEQGLENKITVLLDDYRDLEGQFDKLVSIEMIEAVGHQYYATYFNACSRLLKDDGLMLIQAITLPDQRYHQTLKGADFIQRYIFPGGELPCVDVLATNVSKNTDMQVVGLDDITLDYAKTLQCWRERFLEKLPQVSQQGFDDVFIRMWDFYLAYCEGGFRERSISTIQLLIAKPRCLSLPAVKH
jgi:cyclopropane-fatty-acyl-phospholipid synthase